jgi:protein KTI12
LRNIVIPNAKETINMNRPLSVAELSKLKRQFINYSKMHPISDNELIVSAFVQFINKSI